jgi:hypothetical protein
MEYGSAKNRLFLCSFYGGLKESLLQRFLRLERYPGSVPNMTASLDIECHRTDERRRLILRSIMIMSEIYQM